MDKAVEIWEGYLVLPEGGRSQFMPDGQHRVQALRAALGEVSGTADPPSTDAKSYEEGNGQ